MKKLYSDWLCVNGVCSSEWNDDSLKTEFIDECKNEGVEPIIDVE